MTFGETILDYIKKKDFTATQLFRNAGIDRFFGYDILNDSKLPTRDQVIRLALALNISPDESQHLLGDYCYPTLDSEDERDGVILFALKQGGDVDSTNEALLGFNMEPLE